MISSGVVEGVARRRRSVPQDLLTNVIDPMNACVARNARHLMAQENTAKGGDVNTPADDHANRVTADDGQDPAYGRSYVLTRLVVGFLGIALPTLLFPIDAEWTRGDFAGRELPMCLLPFDWPRSPRVVVEKIQVTTDDGYRRSELMTGVVHERLLRREQRHQPVDHVVECVRETSDLVVAGYRESAQLSVPRSPLRCS